eukprot:gene695-773_t
MAMHFYDRDSDRYDDDSAKPEQRARESDEQKEAASIDDTTVTDLKPIVSRNHTVDFLYASHVLEHLSQSHACEVCQALREWRRVLKHDGTLYVAVPDLQAIATIFTNPNTTPEVKRKMVSILYGGQRDENDYHKTGFFFESLVQLLEEVGFCGMRRVDRFGLFPHDNSNTDEH